MMIEENTRECAIHSKMLIICSRGCFRFAGYKKRTLNMTFHASIGSVGLIYCRSDVIRV